MDDEADIRELAAHHLVAAGYEVLEAATGMEGWDQATRHGPDLILLDVMLPDVSGTEILKRLRREAVTASIPVLLLTARGEEMDRVVGFELGADDYVVKPFSPRELVLRVQAILRRRESATVAVVLDRGGVRLDRQRHEVLVESRPVDLTPLEFRLLDTLMERPGKVFTRQELLDRVWGEEVLVNDRTVDAHIKRLRTKLETAASRVETIRGVGYRFRA